MIKVKTLTGGLLTRTVPCASKTAEVPTVKRGDI
jgi:hypothetical protein